MRIAFVGDSLTEGIPGCSYVDILRGKLAEHTLLNLGKKNDTVVSLHRRIARHRFDAYLDIVFLWVGVNDIRTRCTGLIQIANALLNQRCARDVDEFRACYQATIEILIRYARRVIAVSPAVKGEDLSSPANYEIGYLASVIENLAALYDQVEYLDMRAVFARELAGKSISRYLPPSTTHAIWDALLLHSDEQVDQKSAERGLHLTLDGVHLNSAGARLVAETFLQVI